MINVFIFFTLVVNDYSYWFFTDLQYSLSDTYYQYYVMETHNSKCPWDLNSYSGRWKYYFWISDPKLNFTSNATIEKAKRLLLSDMYVPKCRFVLKINFIDYTYLNSIHNIVLEFSVLIYLRLNMNYVVF